ncbi:unnamed protein product, partial [Laminaria digitata]
MPASKISKGSSTASTVSSVDTSRWENLLSAGSRNSKDGAPVTAAVRLGHRISIAAPHEAVASNLATRDRSTPAVNSNPLARGTDRLPTKKSKQASGSRGGAGVGVENGAWPTNNWQTLLGGRGNAAEATAAAGAGSAAGATATAANNGRLNADAGKRKNKNKRKNRGKTKKLPEFENGTAIRGAAAAAAPSPPDSFDQQHCSPSYHPSRSNGAGKPGKKRKRKGDNSAAASAAPVPPNAGTGGELFQKKTPFSSWSSPAEAASGNNRPRSNVLNLAFQASKDGAGGGQQEGAKK